MEHQPHWPELFFFTVAIVVVAVFTYTGGLELSAYVADRGSAAANISAALPSAGDFKKAEIVSPAPGSRVSFPARFSWTRGAGTDEYWLAVGTTFESLEDAPWGDVFAGSAGKDASAMVYRPAFPLASGAPLYVRLWSWGKGGWQSADYLYEAE